MNLLCSEQVILNDDIDLLAATVTVTTSSDSSSSSSYYHHHHQQLNSSASATSSLSQSTSSLPTFYAGVSTGNFQHHHHQNNAAATLVAAASSSSDLGTRLLNTAGPDPTFLDDRCLENLLKAEEKYSGRDHVSYFSKQRDITPEMRKIVAEWMMEVSAGQIERGILFLL